LGYGDDSTNVADNTNYVDAVTELNILLHTGYVSNIIGD